VVVVEVGWIKLYPIDIKKMINHQHEINVEEED